ncbi:MAG: SMP-30/gluconolactonase/LRE family protein [Rhodospirillaceae bacterium]|nr:SMP-30/gluconolactonase/LRE family protein [Rhodospirillaceae bacterium]
MKTDTTAVPPSEGSRLTRRDFLHTLSAAAVAATAGCAEQQSPPGATRHPFAYDDIDSAAYLSELSVVVEVQDTQVFTEGPAVAADGRVYFTNMRTSKILRWDPATEALDEFRQNTNSANGLMFDARGRLLACEGTAGRVTRMTLESRGLEVLASAYDGLPLDPPNDLCIDSRGRIYFSSRPATGAPSRGNIISVYRIDPDGRLTRLLAWPDVHMPNGVALSPDERTFYLIETHRDVDHHRDLRAYDFSIDDGTLSNERVLVDFYPGRSGDGMAVDEQGNLYVAAGLHALRDSSETLDTRPGIHVFSPQGELLAYRRTPMDSVTNCAFGGDDGRTLYVTAGPYLLSGRSSIPGHRA